MLISSVENWPAIVILRFVFVTLNSLSAHHRTWTHLCLKNAFGFDIFMQIAWLCFLSSDVKEAAVLPCHQHITLWRDIFEVRPGLQSLRVIFKRDSHCVKALSVPTLVVELCEVWEDNVPLTASLMSPGLPQPELRPSVYQRMNMLLCYDGKCGVRD